MFVFKEEYPNDENRNDYCREYRSPKDYGYPCDHAEEQTHPLIHGHGHGHDSHRHESSPCKSLNLPLAEAYIPLQKWDGTYPAEEGLRYGTVFPALYRPYSKGRCAVKCCEAEAALKNEEV